MTVPAGVDYQSLDGEPATLLFLIAAPEGEADMHLEVLSRLSTLLLDESFCAALRAARTPDEFRALVDAEEDRRLAEERERAAGAAARDAAGYDVLAITACPTGIAHTFMAAEALEKMAAEMGVRIKVETQGQGGAKNVITASDVEGARRDHRGRQERGPRALRREAALQLLGHARHQRARGVHRHRDGGPRPGLPRLRRRRARASGARSTST